jgi:hypothetical protein
MWLITPTGFFSIVHKSTDAQANRMTVRTRVRQDLEGLRAQCLPELGEIEESRTKDYRSRAMALRTEVAAAMAEMVNRLDYNNLKSQVAKVQGPMRAHLYHDMWDLLYRLQKA